MIGSPLTLGRPTRRRRLQPGINLVPMLDLVFNLLFFFLLATDFRQALTKMEVRLPTAAQNATSAQGPNDPTAVTIDSEGRLYFKGHEVMPEELDLELHVLAGKGTTKIVVRGDERVNYGKVVELMNRCKTAGLVEVLLDLRPLDNSPSPASSTPGSGF